ncbi:MAG: hypothetical protein JSU07_02415 [Bacteroidetes bacterium]|nr:hypothetical protein [Bacteroidota bacterium]
MENNQIDLKKLLSVLIKNIKWITATSLLAAILAFITTFFLKEKYKSISVIFPANIAENFNASANEELMQYLISNDVKKKVAAKFNLYKRYGIDTLKIKGGNALFDYEFSERVKISSTLYRSSEISVIDEDPIFARDLNYAIIEETNNLIKTRKFEIVNSYYLNAESTIKTELNEIDSLKSAAKIIRTKYNIIDEKSQAKYIAKNMYSSSGKSSSPELVEQAKLLSEKIDELGIINSQIKAHLKVYQEIKIQHDKYLLDRFNNNNYFSYVTKPSLSDKRCYPIRSLFVALTFLSVFIFSYLVALIKATNKKQGVS